MENVALIEIDDDDDDIDIDDVAAIHILQSYCQRFSLLPLLLEVRGTEKRVRIV